MQPEPLLEKLGALDRWRQEIRTGKRQNTAADFDDLHAAACNEAAASEAWYHGDRKRAQWFMDRALLRLHGCYGSPDDETRDGKPGAGQRLMAELRRRAAA